VSIRRIAVIAAATLGLGSGVAFAATLSVGSWHLWAGSQALTKGTCTVTGSANITDATVSQASPTSSSGSATTMQVDPTSGSQQWMFVRVSLSSCALQATAGADTATLKLVLRTPANASRTLTVTPVLSTWSSTLTWNGAQSLTYGTTTTTFATGTSSGAALSIPVTIDVDALLRSSTASYGWRISDAGANDFRGDTSIFNSVEATTSSLRPQLVVNYAQ
jgi:hypothetical protein